MANVTHGFYSTQYRITERAGVKGRVRFYKVTSILGFNLRKYLAECPPNPPPITTTFLDAPSTKEGMPKAEATPRLETILPKSLLEIFFIFPLLSYLLANFPKYEAINLISASLYPLGIRFITSPFFPFEKGASYLRCIWMICRINLAWLLGSFHQFHDMPRKTLTIMLLCLVHQSLS
ncbi:MAG: hypothetical protein Ct9H300mP28_02850 [Pseudomonadota bacterium]|nr:MAG: hypothetical protein Ct9H300mP28_02850 [Pseudomonadota bacterium]